jgi:hypothetical protein
MPVLYAICSQGTSRGDPGTRVGRSVENSWGGLGSVEEEEGSTGNGPAAAVEKSKERVVVSRVAVFWPGDPGHCGGPIKWPGAAGVLVAGSEPRLSRRAGVQEDWKLVPPSKVEARPRF